MNDTTRQYSRQPKKLEVEIHRSWLELAGAVTREGQQTAFDRLRQLVKQRSPSRIREMEEEKGLLV